MSAPHDLVHYARASWADGHVLLKLERHAGREQRALARTGVWLVSHLELDPPSAVRAHLRRLADRFGRASVPTASPEALERLGELVAEGGGTLGRPRSVPRAQRVPHWSAALRVGAPRALADGLPWPYDAELSGLERGVRRLLLREWHAAESAARDAAELGRRGFVVRVVGSSDHGEGARVFASGERAVADDAVRVDAIVRSVATDWADAVAWMGEALGYPRCCVDRFARIRSRTDVEMFMDLLDPLGAPPAPPETAWLDGALALVSHAPCTSTCASTVAQASATLAALDEAHRGFAGIWRAWGRAIHALDVEGDVFWLDVEGALAVHAGGVETPPARVRAARRIVPSVDPDAPTPLIVEQPALVGPTLVLADDRARLGRECDLFLLADHRGGSAISASGALSARP